MIKESDFNCIMSFIDGAPEALAALERIRSQVEVDEADDKHIMVVLHLKVPSDDLHEFEEDYIREGWGLDEYLDSDVDNPISVTIIDECCCDERSVDPNRCPPCPTHDKG